MQEACAHEASLKDKIWALENGEAFFKAELEKSQRTVQDHQERFEAECTRLNGRIQELMAKELAMEEKVRTIESDETYSRADVEKIQEDCQREINAHLERFDKERAAFNEEVQDRVGDKKALEDKIKLLEVEIDLGKAQVEQLQADQEKVLADQKEEFEKECTRLHGKIEEAVANECALADKIKTLETDESYNRAEVEKVLAKEREGAEIKARLQFRIESLEADLEDAQRVSLTPSLLCP